MWDFDGGKSGLGSESARRLKTGVIIKVYR